MGDIANMMLDGTLCAGCGEYMGCAGDGFPRYCSGCAPPSVKVKEKCPTCGRKVKAIGLQQHMRDAHGVKP